MNKNTVMLLRTIMVMTLMLINVAIFFSGKMTEDRGWALVAMLDCGFLIAIGILTSEETL